MSAAGLDAGREGEAGDGVTNHLALTAAETANGIAHEQDLAEVIAAQCGAAKALAGAELTLDRDTVVGVHSKVGGAAVRRVRALFSSARALVFVLEFHFNVCCFQELVEGRRASPLCGEDRSGCCAACGLSGLPHGRAASKAGRGDREGLSGVCGADGCRWLGERC